VNVRDICDELGADYDCAVTGLGERPRHLKSGENIRAGEMSDEANIHGWQVQGEMPVSQHFRDTAFFSRYGRKSETQEYFKYKCLY